MAPQDGIARLPTHITPTLDMRRQRHIIMHIITDTITDGSTRGMLSTGGMDIITIAINRQQVGCLTTDCNSKSE